MLTRALISALDKSQSPRTVHAAAWALERVTGIKTIDLIERKDGTGFSFSTGSYGGESATYAGWYAANGYNGIAGAMGGSSSYSGKNVTIDTALESAAVYACDKIISEDMGGLPFFPFERSEDGKSTEKAYKSGLYRVLHDQPNPEMSAGEFREAMTARAALGADAFAKIERDRNTGEVVMLWPLLDATVTPKRNLYRQLYYTVKEGNQPAKDYKREDLFQLKGFTLNGSCSDPILRRARHAIGLTLAGDEYAGRFFANDASPGVILQRPVNAPKLSADDTTKVKDAWKRWHQGLALAHEPAILVDGTTAVRLDPDHQKLQLIESRKFQIVEVARLFRMPLHKLAELDRSTNNNIEHQGLDYNQNTLGPWRRRWEEAVHRCLLLPEQRYWSNGRPRMYAEFSVEAMVRGDFATQTAGFTALLQNGVYSINQVLGFLNLNPIEGGDVHRVQVNMADVLATAKELTAGANPDTARLN